MTNAAQLPIANEEASPLSVLIVDDDEGMRRSVRRLLLLDDYKVETVGSAAELRRNSHLKEFFAIILDRKLPDADGGELLEELKLLAPQAAILIITGYADVDSTIKAIRTGVHDYLIKPVEPETLRKRLSTLAEFYCVRRELERSEHRMQFLVEHLPAGAVYLDGDRLYGNKTLERITGYSASEIGNLEDWFSILCRGNVEQCTQVYRKNRDDDFKLVFRFLITRKDGARRTLEIAGYRYAQHEIWLVTDVTELEDAQKKLVQSERLAAIGQMVTGLAHESRNALQRARGCLDLLELDLQGMSEQLDLTQRVRRSLKDLQRNYDEVRSYAAPIVLDLADSSLADLLREAFEDLKFEFNDQSHQLHIFQETRCAGIRADPHRVKQMFRNILENSIAASNGTCHIDVRISDVEHAKKRYQRVEIRDDGPGFGSEAMTRLFEPFFTTKQSGTGLGMAICKRIADAHAGVIEAKNNVGGGALVLIDLPYNFASSA